jgi:serine/tyrosine/threonine adenylyltransferase
MTHEPATAYLDLGDLFYDEVAPAAFPETRLRFRNDAWAGRIGLGPLSDEDWVRHLGRFEPLPGSLPQPLALRYHGHQFRSYNPDLGDGRGFLYAQLRDLEDGRLLDLGTKGSGTTPWSRGGDGRLTLKGGVREVLATEMLEALGVYTSKSLSLIETGEALHRNDEPSPTRASVLVRLSHSHVRIGTFQRLAIHGQHDEMRRLVDYCLAQLFEEPGGAEDPVLRFYDLVTQAVARLGAEWYAAGFVHGVLNTDNINVTGESFDYGPWRFQDRYDPAFTAAYFDQTGLYSFARQPEALNWNLARLGECLIPIAAEDPVREVFDRFPARFMQEMTRQTFARLGLVARGSAEESELMHRFWTAMHAAAPPFQQVFHDLLGGAEPGRLERSPIGEIYASGTWPDVLDRLRTLPKAEGLAAGLAHPYAARPDAETMVIAEVEEIWAAIDTDDDWRPFHEKIGRVRAVRGFNERLGLLAGANGRPGHRPIGPDRGLRPG